VLSLEYTVPRRYRCGMWTTAVRERSRALITAAAVLTACASPTAAMTATSPSQPSTTTSATEAEFSDVLQVRCDSNSIKVVTPIVAVQADGVHVDASVSELADPEVWLTSTGDENLSVLSGSSGVDDEFVRELPPGDATVHCESGPTQQDGPERLSATFSLIDPHGVFTSYETDCTDATYLGPTGLGKDAPEPAEGQNAIDIVTTLVTGLQPQDEFGMAGYPKGEPIVRVVREGQTVGMFWIARSGIIMEGRVCPSSGLGYATS
jgi:hypothetical protein